MRRILFASYGGFDFPMIAPVFPFLRQKGYEFAIMNRYDLAPSRKQLRGLTVFQPPDVSRTLLSEKEIERALATFLDTRSLQHLIPLSRGQSPGLRYLLGWSDHYFDFTLETLRRYNPDLTVLSLGEAETSIIRRVCELMSKKYTCLVPQRYEFKSIEAFEGHEGATYMVAGEYGKERMIRKGIKAEHILVTGNPRFDRLFASRNSHVHAPGANRSRWPGFRWPIMRGAPRGSEKIILYTLQAVRNEGRLFQLLRRYVSSRKGVRLVLRPHPNLPRRSYLPFVRHVISEPISLALRGTLGGLLQAADVLVTLWSLTVLEALIVGLPVISWKSDFFPEEMPFASRGDTMPAHTYAELENALDRLLFDPDFRGSWVEKHRDCYIPYIGVLDGTAALRVADAIEALIEDGTTSAQTRAQMRNS
jgi:glycosyltransferase involved in cell wall biosynthesis